MSLGMLKDKQSLQVNLIVVLTHVEMGSLF